MLTIEFGRRYERLLFFAAPISLAAIIVLFVALATASQRDRVEGGCYGRAADVLLKRQSDLEAAWKKSPPVPGDFTTGTPYRIALKHAWIDEALFSSDCYEFGMEQLDAMEEKPVVEIIKVFRESGSRLKNKPLGKAYGVEWPNNTTINLFGTTFKIELLVFIRMLQVVLSPVLLLWLASLYHTRIRETSVIAQATTVADIYPHVINVYLVGSMPEPRKRSAAYGRSAMFAFAAVIRVLLLLFFILPPVAAFLAGLYYMVDTASTASLVLSVIAGFFVFGAFLQNVLLEFMPYHRMKAFQLPGGS